MNRYKKTNNMVIPLFMIFIIATMILSMEHAVASESDFDWSVNDDGGEQSINTMVLVEM